jgi:cation:H+ antiporter
MIKKTITASIFLFIGIVALSLNPSYMSLIAVLLGISTTIYLLYYSSEWVETGFAAISTRFKIPALISGALFLAPSSSMPEFFTAFSGVVLHKIFDIGLFTILWSALFNLCIIVGVGAWLKSSFTVDSKVLRRDMPYYGLTIGIITFLGYDGYFSELDFLVLIACYFVYIIILIFDKSDPYKITNPTNLYSVLVKISVSILLVGLLSHILVTLGLQISKISETLFNIMIPASVLSIIIYVPGTSLSDLFMSIAAIKKGKDSTAIINGIGSNIFDLTICIGIPGYIYTRIVGQGVSIVFLKILPSILSLTIGFLLVFIFLGIGKTVTKLEGMILIVFFLFSITIQVLIL